jgi:hypothetical protein
VALFADPFANASLGFDENHHPCSSLADLVNSRITALEKPSRQDMK